MDVVDISTNKKEAIMKKLLSSWKTHFFLPLLFLISLKSKKHHDYFVLLNRKKQNCKWSFWVLLNVVKKIEQTTLFKKQTKLLLSVYKNPGCAVKFWNSGTIHLITSHSYLVPYLWSLLKSQIILSQVKLFLLAAARGLWNWKTLQPFVGFLSFFGTKEPLLIDVVNNRKNSKPLPKKLNARACYKFTKTKKLFSLLLHLVVHLKILNKKKYPITKLQKRFLENKRVTFSSCYWPIATPYI